VPGRRNILTVHGLVPGIIPVGIVTEPGEHLIDNRLLDNRFDYIALGHIHQAQQVSPNAWYAGAIERFGWNDVTAVPGYNLVEFPGPEQPVQVTHVETRARPMLALKPISGQGRNGRDLADATLAQLEKLNQPNALVRVEFRDTGRPVRRAGTLRSLPSARCSSRKTTMARTTMPRSTCTPCLPSSSTAERPLTRARPSLPRSSSVVAGR
jgi:DNA repair exonuclease SbcCD nuclease subunit